MNRKCKALIYSVFALSAVLLGSTVSAKAEQNSSIAESRTGYKEPVVIDAGEIDGSSVYSSRYSSSGTSDWDEYGSDYFYNEMDSNQKALYDELYALCTDLLENTTDVSAVSGDETGMSEYVEYSGMTWEEAYVVAEVFQFSNPQFYFVNEYVGRAYTTTENYIGLGVYAEFCDGTARASYTSKMKAKVEAWLDQIMEQTSIVGMEQEAHDLVVSNTTYGSNTYDQSCYSVFMEGTSVCAGYAEAFELLCNAVGIDTISVTSDTHEWNKVKLYDEWYVVDCTWDDQTTICYDYFNVSDDSAEYGNTDHQLESLWKGYSVPECSLDTVEKADSYTYNSVDYADVFDPDYYMAKYSDVKNAYKADISELLSHFVNCGMAEGRRGSEAFNVYTYANNYADLRKAYGTDLAKYYLHYINYGKKEGRSGKGNDTSLADVPTTTVYNGTDYASVYDYDYYVANNTDVYRTYGTDDEAVLTHFVNYGMKEGRQGISTFSVTSYRYQYADLRKAYGSDLKKYYLHYMNYGKKEGRSGTGCTTLQGGTTVYNGTDYAAVYNYSYYVSNYSDIAKNFLNDEEGAIQHFVNYGMKEGRQAIRTFNVTSYWRQYADLRSAYGSNLKSYYLHYMNYGKKEGRSGTGCTSVQGAVTVYNGVDYAAVYDYNYYVANNADIAKAFSYDDEAVLKHFVTYGMNEKRQGSASFNVSVYANKNADLRSAYGSNWKSYYLHYIQYGKAEGRTAV